MKTLRKSLLLLIVAVVALVGGVLLSACGNTVTLSFDLGAAENVQPLEDATAEKGTEFELPAAPAWEGHIFDGWYDNAELSGSALGSTVTVPEEDATYYAKWSTGYKLTLDTDGGSLGGETTFWLKRGENVYNVVKDLVPTKSGLTFGAWFSGENAITSSLTMPQSALTLTAKYKVNYTVNVLLQDVDDPETYNPATEYDTTGSDYVGSTVSYSPAIDGFVAASSSARFTLTDKEADNVFEIKYNRRSFTLRYEPNAPDGYTVYGEMEAESLNYGTKTKVAENGFYLDEYRFAGWSTSRDGEVEYLPGADIEITKNIPLYAIWDRGFIDMIGGSDLIYLPRLEADEHVAVLARGGMEFRGTYTEVAGKLEASFSFKEGSEYKLTAKLDPDVYAFAYEREALAGTYTRYSTYLEIDGEDATLGGLVEDETLTLDGYFNATWTYLDGDKKKQTVNGLYQYQPSYGQFVFFILDDEGALTNSGFYFLLSQLDEDGNEVVFLRYGDEENQYRQLVVRSQPGYGSYGVKLDGLGNATLYSANTGATVALGYYGITDYDGNVGYYASILITESGDEDIEPGQSWNIYLDLQYGVFFLRNEDLADTFEGTVTYDGGEYKATLTLDGYGADAIEGFGGGESSAHLTFSVDGEATPREYADTYFAQYYEFVTLDDKGDELTSGYIVSIADGSLFNFLFTQGEDGKWTFTSYDVNYDYYFMLEVDSQGPGVYAPIVFVYNEYVEEDNPDSGIRVEVYSTDENDHVVHAASGALGWTEYYSASDFSSLLYTIDCTKVATYEGEVFEHLVCALSGVYSEKGDAFNVYYIYEYDDEKYYEEWKGVAPGGEDEGDLELTIWYRPMGISHMGSILFIQELEEDGERYVLGYDGSVNFEKDVEYFPDKHYFTFNYYGEEESAEQLTFEYTEGDDVLVDSFTLIGQLPVALEYQDAMGNVDTVPTLVLDGNGDALYLIYEVDDSWWIPTYERVGDVKGTLTQTGETILGDTIYSFVPEANDHDIEAFDFVVEGYMSNGTVQYIYHKRVSEPVYASNEDGDFKFDGFAYYGRYTRNDSNVDGLYTYGEDENEEMLENEIHFYVTTQYGEKEYVIDLQEDGAYTMRDGLQGNYSLYQINAEGRAKTFKGEDYVVTLDGYGKAVVKDGDETIAEGEYVIPVVGDVCTFLFTQKDDSIFPEAEYEFTFESGSTIILMNEEQAKNYISEEGEMLLFDGLGYAEYVDELGAYYFGGMEHVYEGLWLFEMSTSDGTVPVLFEISGENFSIIDNSEYVKTYFAADFTSVEFGEVYATILGVRYVYTVEEDGTVNLYHDNDETYDKTTLSTTMPTEDTWEYEGFTFYLWDTEDEVVVLTAETEEFGEVTLTFAPETSADYTVEAELSCSPFEYTINVYYSAFKDEGAGGTYAYLQYEDFSSRSCLLDLKYDPATGEGTFSFKEEFFEDKETTYNDYMYVREKIEKDNTLVRTLIMCDDCPISYLYEATFNDTERPLTFSFAWTDLVAEATDDEFGTRLGVEVKGSDNNLYGLHFFLGRLSDGSNVMVVFSLDRVFELTSGDFTVVVEQSVYANVYAIEEKEILFINLQSDSFDTSITADIEHNEEGKYYIWHAADGDLKVEFHYGTDGFVSGATVTEQ